MNIKIYIELKEYIEQEFSHDKLFMLNGYTVAFSILNKLNVIKAREDCKSLKEAGY